MMGSLSGSHRSLPLLVSPSPPAAMLLPSVNAELTLDPKGRVMLPRLLRNSLELQGVGKLIAFANAGPQGGLALMRVDEYEKLAAEHQKGGPLDPRARLFALAIASTAHTISVDSNGRVNLPGYPVHFSACRSGTRRAAPTLGQHTDEILREIGCDDSEIDALRQEGVVR